MGRAAHWFEFLVKICNAPIPRRAACSTARWCPPAMDKCAPSNSLGGMKASRMEGGGVGYLDRIAIFD
jgi:hypothetical protein